MEILEIHNTTSSDEETTTVEHLSDRSIKRDSSTHQLKIVPMKIPQRIDSSTNKTMDGSLSTNSEHQSPGLSVYYSVNTQKLMELKTLNNEKVP